MMSNTFRSRRFACILSLAAVLPAYAECPSDVNADGQTNAADLSLVLSQWGGCGRGASCSADLNGDSVVDAADLSLILSGWGPCVTVPSWATLIEAHPDPSVVHDASLREAIAETGLAWRVRDTATQIELVLIPPGTFQMGCSVSDGLLCSGNEGPVHAVTLTSAFYIGRYEVTQAEWQARMGSNPSLWRNPSPEVPPSEVPRRPVDTVTWDNIQLFLSAETLKGGSNSSLRLPTEAEWEYAYRAGTDTAYHSLPGHPDGTNDDQLANEIAWWGSCPGCGGNSGHQTYPVGRKAGNGFGLHDMAGNIYEWVNDWASAPYPQGPLVDPTGPEVGTTRVLRGGSFADARTNLRSSKRYWSVPSHLSNRYGFRVARNP